MVRQLCAGLLVALGCTHTPPAKAPRVASVEVRFYNELPDAYELVGLDVSLEGQKAFGPRETEDFRRDRALLWQPRIDARKHPWVDVTASFRRDGAVLHVNARQALGENAQTVFDFYEAEVAGKGEIRERGYVDPNRSVCLAFAKGPTVTHHVTLVDRTTTGFRVDHVRIDLDGKPLVTDEAAIVGAMHDNHWPTFTSRVAQGCHVMNVELVLHTTSKMGGPVREVVVAKVHAFDAFDQRTEKILLTERITTKVKERPALSFLDVATSAGNFSPPAHLPPSTASGSATAPAVWMSMPKPGTRGFVCPDASRDPVLDEAQLATPAPSASAPQPKTTKTTKFVKMIETGTGIWGPLPPLVIKTTIRRSFPRLRQCYEAALLRDEKTTGIVATEFAIGPDGTTRWADGRSEGTTIVDQEMIDCVQKVFGCFTFAAPQKNSWIYVRYPIGFESGEMQVP